MKKKGKIFKGKTLDIALEEAAMFYAVRKEVLLYSILKDSKTGVFGIIKSRDIEILVDIPVLDEKIELLDENIIEEKPKKEAKGKKAIPEKIVQEEALVHFNTLPEETIASIIEHISTTIHNIVRTVSKTAEIVLKCDGNNIHILIEENEDTEILIGKDTEVLIAIQYILYKIVTHHIRCIFSLFVSIGEALVSEETILIAMVSKLIEKVKITHKTQRTYPLTRVQRTIVEKVLEGETAVKIKPQKQDVELQPIILLYEK